MTVKRSRLRAVPPRVGNTGFENRLDVAGQVMAAGAQDIHVQVIVPLPGPGNGPDRGQGRALVGLRGQTGKPWARSWTPGARQQRWPTRPSARIFRCREWVSRSEPVRAWRGSGRPAGAV